MILSFTDLHNNLNELSKISSTNEKLQWLKDHNDENLKFVFKWYFDNSRITGIAEKKFDKFENTTVYKTDKDSFELFKEVIDYLDNNNTGKDDDLIKIKSFMQLTCQDDYEKETFKKLVCKNYPMGVQSTLINKAFPNLIPTFEVMLADKFYDLKPNQVDKLFNNRTFVLQEKLDGFRCTIHKVGNTVKLVSRQGKLIEGLTDIENAVKLSNKDFVLDGELLLSERDNIPSKLQYKATSKIVSTKSNDKKGITLNTFDFIPIQDWTNHSCDLPYNKRYELLSDVLNEINKPELLHLVNNLYVGSDINVIDKMIIDAKSKEWEGLMIRFTDSKYQWKRSKDLLKVKPFQELDAFIVDLEEGTNSNKGRLGALLCEVNHPKFGNLKFKVGGGFSEDERVNFWNLKDVLIGRLVSVQYFEITENSDCQKSVRFPEFLELKEPGSTPNN